MSHLQSTAEAIAESETRPVPGMGETVIFHPRPGEQRAGRMSFPALVLRSDGQNGLLDLLIFFDADDLLAQSMVPRWVENDRGWEPVRSGAVPVMAVRSPLTPTGEDLRRDLQSIRAEFDAFKVIVEDALVGSANPAPIEPIVQTLKTMAMRLDVLETKRPRGRPPLDRSVD